MSEPAPLRRDSRLELVDVSKSFAGTVALAGVSFDVRAGEVHVVAGENGAGKSTLIRVIAGALDDFGGELRLDGLVRRFASPAAAVAAGIATIHQELALVPSLSIADNFEIARPARAFSLRTRAAARTEVVAALRRLGLDFAPDTLVEALSVAERQLVEIARALVGQVRVLVLDEPTSALSEPDAARLLTLVEELKASGIGIVYISHHLDEIFRLADRITVLRDGGRVFTRARGDVTRAELVNAMVGRSLEAAPRSVSSQGAPVRLRVRGFGVQRAGREGARVELAPCNFELAGGELVGVAGVEGSGASLLLRALFGAVAGASGSSELAGTAYLPKNPRAALAAGVAFLASDRHDSVLPELSVLHNATLSNLRAFSPRGFIAAAAERRAVAPEAKRVKLAAPSLDTRAAALSGGNQQKVALLRCLLKSPRLLLLDDPTRGIDVAARADVHELLRTLARAGTTILFRSTDLGELCALSERALVFAAGRLVRTFSHEELDEARLLSAMMGVGG